MKCRQKLVISIVVFLSCAGSACGGGDGPEQPVYGAYCCAFIQHGYNCGWNYSNMHEKWQTLFDIGTAVNEELCKEQWEDYTDDGSATCDGKIAEANLLECLEDPRIAETTLDTLATPHDYKIPVDFPSLTGEVASVADISFMRRRHILQGIGLGFLESDEGDYFVIFGEFDGPEFILKVRNLETGFYQGSESGDPASLIFDADDFYYTSDECGSVAVTITSGSELALWGEFEGEICNFSNAIPITGTFSAIRPGVRAR